MSYQLVESPEKVFLSNGAIVEPVATLKDEYGGVAHIWVDDNCYCLGLENDVKLSKHEGSFVVVGKTHHIFKEAHEVLKELPSL